MTWESQLGRGCRLGAAFPADGNPASPADGEPVNPGHGGPAFPEDEDPAFRMRDGDSAPQAAIRLFSVFEHIQVLENVVVFVIE